MIQLKLDKGLEYIFLQRRHTSGQQVYEKMINTATHQGNSNLNHKEITPHTG